MSYKSDAIRLPSLSSKATFLIVLLHCVGARAAGLLDLAQQIAKTCPDAAIVIPEAPGSFEGGGNGRQWFSVMGINEKNRPSRIKEIIPDFATFLDRECASYSVDLERLVLVGFSQGAILALEYLSNGGRAGLVISLSGRLSSPSNVSKILGPVEMFHGIDDPIVSINDARRSRSWLKAAGAKVNLTEFAYLGHSIDDRISFAVSNMIPDLMLSSFDEEDAIASGALTVYDVSACV